MAGLRTDNTLTQLEDLLTLVPNNVGKVQDDSLKEDYLKVFKFYEEHSNPELIRCQPLPASEFSLFRPAESYLFLFMQQQKTSRFFPPDLFKTQSTQNLSPKGIRTPFVKGCSAGIEFLVFVANGKNSNPLLKAVTQTRAFELESHLNKYPSVLSAIFSGISVKSKKIAKAETSFHPYSRQKLFHDEFLIWNHFENKQILRAFYCKDPPKLFMNPFGVTLHKPKMSSLTLTNVQTKLQEKEAVEPLEDLKQLEDLDIRDTTRNELKLEFYEEKASELYPGVFVSGDLVARNKEMLKEIGITHVVNCAGNVCENYFPDDFNYVKVFIKDSPTCNIECLFYGIFEFIENALVDNGKVLVHCMQGVSRSVSIVIAYIIFKTRKPYEEVLKTCEEIREICSPNIGFQLQLIWFFKRLFQNFESLPQDPRVFIICIYDLDQPDLVVSKMLMGQTTVSVLDPRTIFLVQSKEASFLWVGGKVEKNLEKYEKCAETLAGLLEKYEHSARFLKVRQGEEGKEFWKIWKEEVRVEVNQEWNDWFPELEDYNELYEESGSSREGKFQDRLSREMVGKDLKNEENFEVVSVKSEERNVE